MKRFELLKKTEVYLAARIIFELGKKAKCPGDIEAVLISEISKEELQQINEAALREGRQPLSFERKQ